MTVQSMRAVMNSWQSLSIFRRWTASFINSRRRIKRDLYLAHSRSPAHWRCAALPCAICRSLTILGNLVQGAARPASLALGYLPLAPPARTPLIRQVHNQRRMHRSTSPLIFVRGYLAGSIICAITRPRLIFKPPGVTSKMSGIIGRWAT